MLPIKLLEPTDWFTPTHYLRIVERVGDYLVVDAEVSRPGAEVIGLRMRVKYQKSLISVRPIKCWSTQLYDVCVDDKFYSATNPTCSRFEVDDLRHVNGLDPLVEYAEIMESTMEHAAGLKQFASVSCMLWTVAEVKEREQGLTEWGLVERQAGGDDPDRATGVCTG